MKSIRKILLLCLAYNVIAYGLIFLYDMVDEHVIETSFPGEELAMVVLFLLMPLSVIVAEALGFSRDCSRKERIVYPLVWAGITVLFMFPFGDYAAGGGFIEQAPARMLNGIEYYYPGICVGYIMPALYLILWLLEELYAWWKKRRSEQ